MYNRNLTKTKLRRPFVSLFVFVGFAIKPHALDYSPSVTHRQPNVFFLLIADFSTTCKLNKFVHYCVETAILLLTANQIAMLNRILIKLQICSSVENNNSFLSFTTLMQNTDLTSENTNSFD